MLNVINPKDGTDYFVGGLDADRDKGIQWMTGNLAHTYIPYAIHLEEKITGRKLFKSQKSSI